MDVGLRLEGVTLMSEDYSVVKVPEGKCACCGEEYGKLVLVGTGEVVSEYTDCTCFDSQIDEELLEEEHRESVNYLLGC